jgi:mono/diheme cytochrome c family protein
VTRVLVVLALVETAWLLYPAVRARVIGMEETPAVRGQRLAGTLGCFACHGPGGGGGTPNPGSEEKEVPAFTERTQMMYVKTPDDLREYVLDGAPKRRREDPEYRAKMEAAALRMPAYRDFVTAAEVEDLVTYLRAASDQVLPDAEDAAHGAELATELGCAHCHGPLGAGGVANPGSFKGYVPGFWGEDFDELVLTRTSCARGSPMGRSSASRSIPSAAASSSVRPSRCRPTSASCRTATSGR